MKNRKMIAALVLAGALVTGAVSQGMSLSAEAEETESADTDEKPAGSKTQGKRGLGGPGNGETPPERPDGDPSGKGGPGSGETPPERPDGDSSGNGGPGNGQAPEGGSGGGPDTQAYDYEGDLKGALTADGKEIASDGEEISSDTADENAALSENGGTLTITKGTLNKSGDDTDGDRCNFYGLNAILLSSGEDSLIKISDSTLSADSEGSNGIFATDSGTAYARKVRIRTTAGSSRGLDATYGGTIIGDELTISTQGDHSAALATDRGGGDVSVTGSDLSTAGSGSPLIYSTGDIEVKDVTGTASGSQIAGMEGKNRILILDSDLTSTNTGTTGSDPVANGVIIYQSTSKDADTASDDKALFQAVDSTLTSKIDSGSMFYVTNTSADIFLKNTDLAFDSDRAELLRIEGNDANNWGQAGSNGGTVTFTGRDEDLEGDISVDTISSLDLYLLDGTTYTGAMKITENEAGNEKSSSPITVNISSDSTWVLTSDTQISALNVEKGGKVVDEDGKTVTIKADGKTVVEGDSGLTLTVTGSYGTTVKTTDANEEDTDYIDRTDFDSAYGTSTAFTADTAEDKTRGTSGEKAVTSSETGKKEIDPVRAAAYGGGIFALLLAAGGAGIYAGRKKVNKKKDEKKS